MSKVVRPANFRSIPYDGLVRVDHGTWLVIGQDAFPDPSAEFHRERMGRIRGEFLGAAFSLDNELVLIILLNEFGSLDASAGGAGFDKREFDLRRETLGKLIGLVDPIASQKFGVEEGEAWSGESRELLQVRNALAHQTFWLQPVNDDGAGTIPGSPLLRTVSFVPMIADRKSIWTVDDDQVAYWNALLNSVFQRAKQLRKSLPVTAVADEKASADHSYPLAVFIPDGRAIPNPESKLLAFYHGAGEPELDRVAGPKLAERLKERVTLAPYVERQMGTGRDGSFPADRDIEQ